MRRTPKLNVDNLSPNVDLVKEANLSPNFDVDKNVDDLLIRSITQIVRGTTVILKLSGKYGLTAFAELSFIAK
jgi:hypothetical protein